CGGAWAGAVFRRAFLRGVQRGWLRTRAGAGRASRDGWRAGAVGVANADEAFARLLALGATPLDAVTDVGGGIRCASVADPFGNRFGIIENPHFDASTVR